MKNNSLKIFTKSLSLNLDNLNKYLKYKYEEMKLNNYSDKDTKFYDPGNHWETYNIFNFYNEEIFDLKKGVLELTKENCSYYGIDFDEQKYMIHGWFNYYPVKTDIGVSKENLRYHDHFPNPMTFHGYYCVNAEPSITYYKDVDNKIFDQINKNNTLIVAKNGFPHSPGEWNQDTHRITIAYNILPLSVLIENTGTRAPFIPL